MHSRQFSTEGNCQISSEGVHIADIPVLEAWHGVSFCPWRALTACLHVFDLQTQHTKLCMARPHAILMQHLWYKMLVTHKVNTMPHDPRCASGYRGSQYDAWHRTRFISCNWPKADKFHQAPGGCTRTQSTRFTCDKHGKLSAGSCRAEWQADGSQT